MNPEEWSPETKRPEALANAVCYTCRTRPETIIPLSDGWCWDTMEPTNHWLHCPACLCLSIDDEEFDERELF